MGKIMHAGVEYGGGGGGSDVSITPILSEGTKIAEFEIDGVTGELFAPEGGSGGSSYEYTQLYTGTTNPETMTLNDDISNYDVIYIRTANTNGYSVTALFRAQDLIDGIGQNVQFGIANDSEFFYFRVTSQTLFTRFSSVAQFPVEIGGMKFGGGSGGSGITYGYTNPTGSASDGALYILLDANNKEKGKFLYMLNEWVLISGSMILPPPIMKYKYVNNYQAVPYSYTYTVDKAGNYFAFVNIAAMGGSADIVSTGTQKYYNTFGADANRKTVVAVFECNVGDTITLTMDKTGTSYQDYYILAATILDMNTSFDTVTLESLQAKVENNTATATASTTGLKFGFAFNGCLPNVGHSLSFTPTNIEVVEFNEEDIKYMECLATIDGNLSSISAVTSNSSGYATSVALILKLSSGTPPTHLVLYDNGTEEVPWTVSGGTKNASDISLNVGGGVYTNYAVIDNPIDLTDYNTLHVECRYDSRDYNLDLDISNYTGSKYISFTYLTDTSHNEAAIGITDTKTGAATIRIDSRNTVATEQLLYYMSLS